MLVNNSEVSETTKQPKHEVQSVSRCLNLLMNSLLIMIHVKIVDLPSFVYGSSRPKENADENHHVQDMGFKTPRGFHLGFYWGPKQTHTTIHWLLQS